MIQVTNFKLRVTCYNRNTLTVLRSYALTVFFLSAIFLPFTISAQKAPHEFSLNAGAGVSTYVFSPLPKKASSVGFNTDFGFGFTGFFSRQVGIHVGAGFGLFNVKSKVNELYTLTPDLSTYKVENGVEIEVPYELHTTLNGYTDIHKTLYISIPLMFQFQTAQRESFSWKNTQKVGFYARGGVKVLLLFNNKYEARIPTMYNKAYFPTLNQYQDTQEFMGFGTFKGNTVKGNLDFGVLATFSLEVGAKWRIENNMFIYTGVFFDCGLNDPIKDSRKKIGAFDDGLDAKKLLEDVTILKYADRANLMAVGIRLHFAFSRKTRPW